MIKLKKIQDVNVKNKTVLLRADLDVPIIQKTEIRNNAPKIADDTRLKAWLPTLEFLLKNQAGVYIAGHLGRPEAITNSNPQTLNENRFSLEPVAEWIKDQLELHNEKKIIEIQGFKGWEITGNLTILENLRFYKEEEENNQEFSKKLSQLADIYVNDAFASSHRAHASIVGVPEFLPSYAGFRLEKEVEVLSNVLENPKRPLVIIIGGAKIETKLPLVEKMHKFADFVLVGGEIAENDKVLLKLQREKLTGVKSVLLVADLTEDRKDITQKSAENFIQACQTAKTIVWNGPMGFINEKLNIKNKKLKVGDEGYTGLLLAQGIINSGAYTVVGGGDTLGFLKQIKLIDKFSFASTGGGATLEFLAGEKLPGIEVLIIN